MAKQLGDPPAYDAIADWYADYVTGAAAAFTARAGEALRRVLGRGHGVCWDVACGTGVYADRIRQLGWIPIGTDISIAQLRRAATQMSVAVADATRLAVQPGSVAAVASVLCHTDVDDYAAVCRAAATALVAGGRFAHVGVHPCFCGAFVDRSNSEHVITTPGYWRRDRRFDGWSPNGVRARVGATHLPLSDLIVAVDRGRVGPGHDHRSGRANPRRARHPGPQTRPLINSAQSARTHLTVGASATPDPAAVGAAVCVVLCRVARRGSSQLGEGEDEARLADAGLGVELDC